MAEEKFTKGEWEVGQRPVDVLHPNIRISSGAFTFWIAAVQIVSSDEHIRQECEANARLIAAAPDLYNALKAIVDCYGLGQSPEKFVSQVDGYIEDARAIVKKAQG